MKKLIYLALTLLLILPACSPDAPQNNDTEEPVMQNPIVTITMDDGGVIKAELYPDKAPNTVANFVTLIQSGFYDGLVFHRTSDTFMIQGGDPEGTGGGGPGHVIKGEFASNGFTQNDISHERGVLSMARRNMPLDSAGSQFFICVVDCDFLDGDYAAFGKVIEGMDVADGIAAGPNNGEREMKALEPRVMETVTVETFGVEYTAETIKD